MKRGKLGSAMDILGSYVSTSIYGFLGIGSGDELRSFATNSSAWVITSNLLRDPSAWYHIVYRYDSANASSTERVKIYINGVEAIYSTDNRASYQNQASGWNRASTSNGIGAALGSISGYFDGYITEFYHIDGQALTPSSFGETDAVTGRWKAKAYSGTYGTNGFYLKFADNSSTAALGTDSSGNGNTWTTNNFSVTAGAGNDSLVDSPTNYGSDTGVGGTVRGNYATLNTLDIGANVTLANGNLDFTSATTAYRTAVSTIAIPSGSWYFEITAGSNSAGENVIVGIQSASEKIQTNYVGSTATSYSYTSGARKYNNTTSVSYGATWTSGDVIGIAFDGSTLSFYKNGASQGNAYTGLSGNFIFSVSAFNSSAITNFGQRPFAYAAPSGFKALCTTNLTTPTIKKPSSYMDVVTYTGNGGTQTISGLGFSPDLVWVKGRSQVSANHILTDRVRGNGASLMSNNTNVEGTRGATLTSNGFSFTYPDEGGDANFSAATYVAWAWDEAPIAGMDIVNYTGDNNSSRTISHTLGVVPSMIILKPRSGSYGTEGWQVWHKSLSASNVLQLHSTAAQAGTGTFTSGIISSSPTASVFGFTAGVGGVLNVNASSTTYIAYLFSEIEGFSKFGSYTGNGSSDGPFVWCGFRPRWILIKRYDGGSESWILHDAARDTYNVTTNGLRPNSSLQEASQGGIDILSNGFKIRTNLTDINASGASMIFSVFAESPFKYSRAR
jgi:hypothetical protein